ncbi:glycosyltransferase [Sphingomonas sp. PAMC 26617]|uniref:glycosyltransferase n=1 Tax=Sphingomonas sp. PAMC 26617 TaxID=1112216 RepID=UPI0002885B00|nr:glycosyltransferase [Sphingomonas sp. PAMC 26617]
MRIVDVNEFYSPTGGGVRTYIDRKMGIMADLGHELIVIAPGREPGIEERPGGGRVITVQTGHLPLDANYGIFWDGAPVLRLLDQLQPDVVETSSPWRLPWVVGKWQGNAVKAFFMHNDNMAAYALRWLEGLAPQERIERAFNWYSRYMDSFLVHFDAVVTNGPALEKRLKNRGVRIDVSMPLGIERGHFSPELRDERLRAALLAQCGLPATGHLLLGLGRHHPEKRWRLVIDAVERAGSELPVGLMLLGNGVESAKIEARIAGSPHIRMFRPVYDRERLARIVASCDALIHGSEAEPFGLVASEAMAGGLPLIVPDTGGCMEVADPLSSEFYTARDAQSAASAIHRLFARDPRVLRRAALVAATKVRSDREHTIELMDYYQGLVDAKRAGRLLRAA